MTLSRGARTLGSLSPVTCPQTLPCLMALTLCCETAKSRAMTAPPLPLLEALEDDLHVLLFKNPATQNFSTSM